jgi:hypothetical protein
VVLAFIVNSKHGGVHMPRYLDRTDGFNVMQVFTLGGVVGWRDVLGPARIVAWTPGSSASAVSRTGSPRTRSASRRSAAVAARPRAHVAAAPTRAPAAAVPLLACTQRVWRNEWSRDASNGQVSWPCQHEKLM